jgi:GNAT superfamily N-acetyltransferase
MARLTHGDYVIDDDPERIDLDAIHRFLATDSYWATGRSRDAVIASVAGSARVVGAYLGNELVGFARVVSDGVAIAYLADVFVLDDHRGKGLGTELVRTAIEDGPFAGLRWIVHTDDAHGLYQRFGFAPPDDKLMERPNKP